MERSDRLLALAGILAVTCFVAAGLLLLARRGPATTSDPTTSRATVAALAAVEGGHVTEVESMTREGAAWEVDVITPAGTQVDVRLDENYGLVGIDAETDESLEHAGG